MKPLERQLITYLTSRTMAFVRKLHGLPQSRMAELSGISQSALSKLENGDTQFTAVNLIRICNAMGEDAGSILGFVQRESQKLLASGTAGTLDLSDDTTFLQLNLGSAFAESRHPAPSPSAPSSFHDAPLTQTAATDDDIITLNGKRYRAID